MCIFERYAKYHGREEIRSDKDGGKDTVPMRGSGSEHATLIHRKLNKERKGDHPQKWNCIWKCWCGMTVKEAYWTVVNDLTGQENEKKECRACGYLIGSKPQSNGRQWHHECESMFCGALYCGKCSTYPAPDGTPDGQFDMRGSPNAVPRKVEGAKGSKRGRSQSPPKKPETRRETSAAPKDEDEDWWGTSGSDRYYSGTGGKGSYYPSSSAGSAGTTSGHSWWQNQDWGSWDSDWQAWGDRKWEDQDSKRQRR